MGSVITKVTKVAVTALAGWQLHSEITDNRENRFLEVLKGIPKQTDPQVKGNGEIEISDLMLVIYLILAVLVLIVVFGICFMGYKAIGKSIASQVREKLDD